MELIILTDYRSTSRKYNLKPRYMFIMLVAILLVTFLAYTAGLNSAINQSSSDLRNLTEYNIESRNKDIREQQILIDSVKEKSINRLDALASRLSQLQGHILRLDALGSRLVEMAKLDDIEFRAIEPLGMGGPNPVNFQSSVHVHDFINDLEQLALTIQDREEKLTAIESMLIDRDLQEQTLPDGNPINNGWISSLFGWRADPINGKREFHAGIDLSGKPGTEVNSVATGIVTWSGKRYGFGNMLEINHGNGYVTRYAHNKKNLVNVGDKVTKGQKIAIMGSTGRSTGTHVHFEVIHNGKQINPKKFIVVK